MAHHDAGVREGARQIHHVGKLGMKSPGVEGQAERGEAAQPRAEIRLPHEMRARGGAAIADDVAGVPRRGMAHAAEAPAPGLDQSLQHGLDAIAEGEVREAHDARSHARGAVLPAVAHGGHPGHEFRLADRAHLFRAVRAIHGVAFHEHGGHGVVAAAHVVEKLVKQVAVVRALPQVMMSVDDGQIRLEDGLGRPLGQPRLVRRVDAAELRRPRGAAHPDFRMRAAPRSSTGSTSSAFAAGRLKRTRATPASR